MNLRLSRFVHCAAAIALLALYPSNGKAAVEYDRINVTSTPYLAIPNDNTPDTTQIMAAINKVVPTPTPGYTPTKSIYFPAGTYIFNGPMTLPANKSIRLYGDGPGVSKIIFTGSNAGISGNLGRNTLTVEGLTLQANSANCGTAIDVTFGPHWTPAPEEVKFRTATIHNVQILGSTKDADSPGYWTSGIHFIRAQNSVIDKVEISGRRDQTQTGIFFDNDPLGANTSGFHISNIAVKWCNIGLKMDGNLEGLYMTGFQFFSCGRGADNPSVKLIGSGATPGAFQMVNGLVDTVGGGVHMANFIFAKVSNVSFKHNGSEVSDSTLLSVYNVHPVVISECSFYGMDPHGLFGPYENGIFLQNATAVQITGNHFTNMHSENAGSGIVVYDGSSLVRITDNVFTDVTSRINNQVGDTYFCGNSPTNLCDGVTP